MTVPEPDPVETYLRSLVARCTDPPLIGELTVDELGTPLVQPAWLGRRSAGAWTACRMSLPTGCASSWPRRTTSPSGGVGRRGPNSRT
jgi:hypothetical protein